MKKMINDLCTKRLVFITMLENILKEPDLSKNEVSVINSLIHRFESEKRILESLNKY